MTEFISPAPSDSVCFRRALHKRRIPEIIRILTRFPQLANDKSVSPLHWACQHGNAELVSVLLDFQSEVNMQQTLSGATPLHYVLKCRIRPRMEKWKVLLEKGADASIRDEQGISAFAEACIYADTEAIKLMLDHGVNTNTDDIPLLLAVRSTREATRKASVAMLVRYGADVDRQNRHGESPLTEAVNMGRSELVEVMAPLSRRVNARCRKGRTMLMQAVKNCQIDIVVCLLQNGANPEIADRKGSTALMRACQLGQFSAIYALLRKSPSSWERLHKLVVNS